LYSSTHSRLAVIGGILVIAIADALSDAMGIHISEESESRHSQREIWEATISTFLSKFLFTLTFILPVSLFQLPIAVLVSVCWGLLLLGVFSFYMAREQGVKAWRVVAEHLVIALVVVGATHYIGDIISATFT